MMFVKSGRRTYSKSYPAKPKCSNINKPIGSPSKYEYDSEAVRKELELQDFLKKTTNKGIVNEVRALVEEAEEKQKYELDLKRQRLKNLLHFEENAYVNEVIERQQEILQDDVEQRHEAFLQVKIHQERERQQFLEKKKLQQHLNNCEELRSHLRQTLLEESKMCQLKQIEDRNKKIASEEDEDEMWHQVLTQMTNEQLSKEYAENELCHLRNLCMVATLNEQVASKGDAKHRKRVEEAEERRSNALKNKEIDELEKKRVADNLEKQNRHAIDLKRQREQKSLLMEEFTANEWREGKMLADRIQHEQAEQRNNHNANIEKSREEIFEFLHYLEKMRDDEKLTMAEQEVEIRAHQEKAEAEKVAELKRLKGRRQQLQEETYKGQLRQITDLQKIKNIEMNAKLDEARRVNEEHRQFVELEKEAAEKRHEECIEMRRTLQDQIDHKIALKANIREESNADLRELQALNEAYNQLTSTILNSETNVLPLHPNYEKLITYHNRFAGH